MKLPHFESATVPTEKVVDYLLSVTHPTGRNKAVIFQQFGFTSQDWQLFANSLSRHASENEVVKIEDSEFGRRYVVEGTMETPSGRLLTIRAIWFIEHGATNPRLISAYPLRGSKQ